MRISVVIPTRMEAANIGPLLAELDREATPHEVIVVDALTAGRPSEDGTAAVARALGATVLLAPMGRGSQLAAGAAAAKGDGLLFLHADTRFPAGGLAAVRAALERRPDSPGGNFRLLFDGNDALARWLDGFYALIRSLGFIYGDSGIFVRRAAYARSGGMRALPVMEDYDFIRRVAHLGPLINISEPPLVTSTRRFRGRWWPAIVLRWLRVHALYYLGASGERMARIYDRAAGDTPLGRQGRSLSDQS